MADDTTNDKENMGGSPDIEEIIKQRLFNKNKEVERKTMENEQLKQQLAQIQEQMTSAPPQNPMASDQEQGMASVPNQQENSPINQEGSNQLTRQDLLDSQQQMQEKMENDQHFNKVNEMLKGDPKFREVAEKFNKRMPLQVEKDLINNLPQDEAKKILHKIMTNEDTYNKMLTNFHESTLYGNQDAYSNWVKAQLNQRGMESDAPNEGPDLKGSEGAPAFDKMDAIKGYLKR